MNPTTADSYEEGDIVGLFSREKPKDVHGNDDKTFIDHLTPKNCKNGGGKRVWKWRYPFDFILVQKKKKLRSDKFRMHIGSPACHPRENHASFSRVYALKDRIRSLVQITLHEVAKLERPL